MPSGGEVVKNHGDNLVRTRISASPRHIRAPAAADFLRVKSKCAPPQHLSFTGPTAR
jgi:hypothetical protein